MKYVQNNHIASIACVYKTKDNTGTLVSNSVMFRIESVDKITGIRVNSNFTKVEDNILEELKLYSKVFSSYVATGKFVIHEDIPAEYMTGDDILVDLRFKLQKAEAKVTTLEEENKALKAKITALNIDANKKPSAVVTDAVKSDDVILSDAVVTDAVKSDDVILSDAVVTDAVKSDDAGDANKQSKKSIRVTKL